MSPRLRKVVSLQHGWARSGQVSCLRQPSSRDTCTHTGTSHHERLFKCHQPCHSEHAYKCSGPSSSPVRRTRYFQGPFQSLNVTRKEPFNHQVYARSSFLPSVKCGCFILTWMAVPHRLRTRAPGPATWGSCPSLVTYRVCQVQIP